MSENIPLTQGNGEDKVTTSQGDDVMNLKELIEMPGYSKARSILKDAGKWSGSLKDKAPVWGVAKINDERQYDWVEVMK